MDPPKQQNLEIAPIRHFRKGDDGFRWDDVLVKAYRTTGTNFKDVTRQVLFDAADDLAVQIRYFEIDFGGHSTLERHNHVHAVLILSGRGQALVGDHIYTVSPFDLVRVPQMTWHQFRANAGEKLGFLCLVARDRDRPQRPTHEELRAIKDQPRISDFIRF